MSDRLREDKVVGGLVIRRRTAGGFAPSIPTLLQTFAGQAVLAIENAPLFQELMARGEEARRARTAAEAARRHLRQCRRDAARGCMGRPAKGGGRLILPLTADGLPNRDVRHGVVFRIERRGPEFLAPDLRGRDFSL